MLGCQAPNWNLSTTVAITTALGTRNGYLLLSSGGGLEHLDQDNVSCKYPQQNTNW